MTNAITITRSACFFALRPAWPGATPTESMRQQHQRTHEDRKRFDAETSRRRSEGEAYSDIQTTWSSTGIDALPPNRWVWNIDGQPIGHSEPCPVPVHEIETQCLMGAEWSTAAARGGAVQNQRWPTAVFSKAA